jgi:hypothetical protein
MIESCQSTHGHTDGTRVQQPRLTATALPCAADPSDPHIFHHQSTLQALPTDVGQRVLVQLDWSLHANGLSFFFFF